MHCVNMLALVDHITIYMHDGNLNAILYFIHISTLIMFIV